MFKKFLFLFLIITINGFCQDSIKNNPFQEKINQFQQQNNLEEYYYAFFDEYIKSNNYTYLENGLNTAWRTSISTNEKIAAIHLKVNLGYYFLQHGAIQKSITYYEKALDFYQSKHLKNYDIVNYCLKPLANNYTRIGDYERAEELLKFTINIALNNSDFKQLSATYQNLAIAYQSQSKYKKANKLLKKSLKINGISTLQKNKLTVLLAKNEYYLKNYAKALKLLKPTTNTSYQKELTQALCYFKLKNTALANTKLTKAFHKAKTEKASARELAKIKLVLAQESLKEANFTNALDYYNDCLALLIPNKNIAENLFAENTLMDALDGKAQVFSLKKEFNKAIKNYKLAFKVSQLLQKVQGSQSAKIILQQENKIRSEQVVALYYQQFLKTKKHQYIEDAFQFIEQNKAQVLLEKIQQNSFNNTFKSDSLLLQKTKLEKRIAILQNQIVLEGLKGKKAKVTLLKQLNIQKTNHTIKLNILKQEIFKKHPLIAQISKPVSTSEIQQTILTKEHLLIHFFDTKTAIYIFSLSKDKPVQLRKYIKTPIFNANLQTYIDLFVKKQGNKIKNEVSIYLETAHYLYKNLLAAEVGSSSYKNLTIIPDGKLNFVAFDALLTQKTKYINFEELPYLLYDYQINYGYSSSILVYQKTQKETKRKQTNTLGVFPYFEYDYRGLSELKNTLTEKTAIENSTTKILFIEKATKENFLKNATHYNTIHLATHASAGTFNEPAHIEFRNTTLYLPEIYGLDFKTHLMVLSACETGIGKLQKGEGSMSLARGFLYAGVQNLIVSQWKVNDKSTSILMQYFYHSYQKTQDACSALHQSKLAYLKDSNISNFNKSPYYWAGFQFIGTVHPLKSTTNIYFWIILLFLGFIGVYSVINFSQRLQNKALAKAQRR